MPAPLSKLPPPQLRLVGTTPAPAAGAALPRAISPHPAPRLPVPSSQVSAAYSPSPYKVTDAPRAVVASCRPGPPAIRSPATELIVARTATMADRVVTAANPPVDLRFGICLTRSLIFVSTPAPSPKMPATGKSRRSLQAAGSRPWDPRLPAASAASRIRDRAICQVAVPSDGDRQVACVAEDGDS